MDFTQAKRNKKLDQWVLIILLCSLCLGMNYLVSKLNWKIDLSEKSEYSLSQESLALLNKLHSPVDIIVTIRENGELPKITLRFLHDLNLLLESLENSPSKKQIRVTRLDVDSPKAPPNHIKKYQINENNLIVVASPNKGKKTVFRYETNLQSNPYDNSTQFRSEDSLAREAIWESGFYADWQESYNGVLEPKQFRGEETLVRAMLEVAGTKSIKNTAYFTTGHGEASPIDFDKQKGYSELKRMLEDKNLRVASIDLSLIDTIPDDAKIIVIAGPRGTFQDQEIDHLRSFMNELGGKLIIAVDPVEEMSILDRPVFGLRPLLKEWGIRCHDMLIHDPNSRNFDFFTGAYILRTYLKEKYHQIIKHHIDMGLSIQSERCRPVETFKSELDTHELLYSSKSSIGLSGWTQRENPPVKNPLLDLGGNIPIISISGKKVNRTNRLDSANRMAVIGSSSILSNKYVSKNTGNELLAKNLIYWINGNTAMLDIPPRLIQSYRITMQEDEFEKFLYIITIIPVLIAISGIFVGWLRKEL